MITAAAASGLSSCGSGPATPQAQVSALTGPPVSTKRAVSVVATIPAKPKVRAGRDFCEALAIGVEGSGASPRDPVLSVTKNPTSALVYWLPGDNAKPCRVVSSTLSTRQASALAESIDSTPPMGNGVFNCGMGDGSAAEVHFHFADGVIELANVELNDCLIADAPGRSAVEANALHAPASVLLGFAPTAWRADNPLLSGKF